MNRTEEPTFLKENKKKWTKKYIKTGKWNSKWYGKSRELLIILKKTTDFHCAFCDDVLSPKGSAKGQIEHFRPKEKYKLLSFSWINLFPICEMCNSTKSDNFDILLLRSDSQNFDFANWFYFDLKTFEIKPNKLNSEWKRAEKTIEIYGFNKQEKLERRAFVFENREQNLSAFRFM